MVMLVLYVRLVGNLFISESGLGKNADKRVQSGRTGTAEVNAAESFQCYASCMCLLRHV